jgi:hypothetical protein
MNRKVLLSVGCSVELTTLTINDEAVCITMKLDTVILSHSWLSSFVVSVECDVLTRFTGVVQINDSDVNTQSVGNLAGSHLVAVAVDIRSNLLGSGSYTLLFN